jgi:hypothetical protein
VPGVLLVDSENDGVLAVNRYVECFETNVNTIYAETLPSHRWFCLWYAWNSTDAGSYIHMMLR